MKDLALKQNVLKEIMDLMDEKEGESLKSHPKLMAAKIEVAKPEDEALSKLKEGSPEEEASEAPAMEAKESSDGSEISPEDLQKLLEHFKDLR